MADRMVTLWRGNRNRLHARASRRSARAPAWKYLYPTAMSSLTASTRPLLRARPRLRSARKESLEHPAPRSVTVVVAEHVLVHVGLQVLRRDSVVHAADSAPQERPEPLD